MSLDSLAAQMKVTDAEIDTWAQVKYPQFLANKRLIKRLYLIEKGVRFALPQPKELRSINQLVIGETADIHVVVVQELSTRTYIGCPNDSMKIPDAIEGKDAACPRCGQIVKPKSLQWALFLVGDVTDEIIASFPPSMINRPTEKMIIVAQGLLGENEEFLVYRWSQLETKEEGQTEQPQTPSPQSSVPSELARKLARKAGLLHKDYPGFERNFSASFSGEDLQAAIASANCKVIEGKVVFVGG